MANKFEVTITKGLWEDKWPVYFNNFYMHCRAMCLTDILIDDEINRQLKPHGTLIKTKTRGWYLCWDSEEDHLAFVLKWS